MKVSLVLALAIGLIAQACNKEGNPVLPTDPGASDPGKLTITVVADRSQLETGSTAAATLKITARRADGAAPPDGTQVTINTSLGNFGVDATGQPIQLVTRSLTSGAVEVPFFAGSKAGVANILAQAGTAVGGMNLTIVDPPPAPVADFTFSQSGLSVLFTDASTGSPTSYRWRFGDGAESTVRSPQHTYANKGSYTVTLEVSNSGGQSNKSKFVEVTLGLAPLASFEFSVTGSQVNFVDRSKNDPTSWSWVFGDGDTSSVRNPIHTYGAPGTYTVTLIAANAAGSNGFSDAVKIDPGSPPVAKFKATITGRQVNFIDQSTGEPTSWSWNFGDGGTSTQSNPLHTYPSAGTFTVLLTVANAAGSNSTSDTVKIESGTPPTAAFGFAVTGHQANFVDQSAGNPTSWSWSFGDGGTSTQQNPVHVYAASGNYTVTLTVSNDAGSNSAGKVVPIAAGIAPKAAFEATVTGLQVNFVDRSTGGPTSWLWNFGDGTPLSNAQNPVHTYAAPGSYTVTLTVSNSSGSDSFSAVVKPTS